MVFSLLISSPFLPLPSQDPQCPLEQFPLDTKTTHRQDLLPRSMGQDQEGLLLFCPQHPLNQSLSLLLNQPLNLLSSLNRLNLSSLLLL